MEDTVVLALGGGAARGLAHIGVLRGLEEDGVRIAGIVGTSMGAVVGGLKAQGFRASDMEELFGGIDWQTLGRVLIGSLHGQAFDELLHQLLGTDSIEEARLAYCAVCCDFDSGDEVVLRSGPLTDAVRASSSIPGLLPPLVINGRTLVDGALATPVPVAAARELAAVPVLAVNVLSLATRSPAAPAPQALPDHLVHESKLLKRLQRWILRHKHTGDAGQNQEAPGRWEALMRSFNIMQNRLATSHCRTADLLIEPAVGDYGWFEFTAAPQIINAGYEAYRERMR